MPQLQWFRGRLERYRARGWLRLAAVHHGVAGGGRLRDTGFLDESLGQSRLVNMLLHGHASDAGICRLPSGLVALPTGAADGTPARYQLVTVRRDELAVTTRRYTEGNRWAGDSGIGADGRERHRYELTDVDAAFPVPEPGQRTRSIREPDAGPPPDRVRPVLAGTAGRDAYMAGRDMYVTASSERVETADSFLARVAEATRIRFPEAIVSERTRGACDYLRVSRPLDGGGAEIWPVGVIDGPAAEDGLAAFVADVHTQFAAADPQVRSELVHAGPAAAADLVARARAEGVRLRSFVDYQGLLDLAPLAERQRDRLAADRIYPARLYVDQRYRIVSGGGHTAEVRTGLIDRAVQWLDADGARLVVVLGDFGRGKTSFLRQLTRLLPSRLPAVTPILVELRSLEKAPSLDELLAQHLARQGVEDINLGKLRYMISSGRIALLLDGFDELELRVGYENAADYLQRLITAVTGEAKVILTSRTQHFRSTKQVRDALSGRVEGVRTALGERVETRPESRVVVLEEFSDEQIVEFLTNLYEGDAARARARFDLIRGIGNLLDLAHNPRMLGFVADLDEERLRAAQNEDGQISAARLYEKIIDRWLDIEAERHRHKAGLPAITKEERLAACTAFAFRLWGSKGPTIALHELSAEVAATLTGLAERGYSEEQAAHSIASGSLLVRTDDGAFTFIHQSIMEWLVAKAAAAELDGGPAHKVLGTRHVSRLMATFFVDLVGNSRALEWAGTALQDQHASEAAKQNALAVMGRVPVALAADTAMVQPEQLDLAGADLRGQDLTGRNLFGVDLRGADLRGMRLDDVNLTSSDLTGADLTGVVMTGGSLRGAILTDSTWDRTAILGTEGLGIAPELAAAAVAGRDPAEVMVGPYAGIARCVAFCPDGALLAYGSGNLLILADAGNHRIVRVLRGHRAMVTPVAFSPDGTLIATASADGTARIWDTGSATLRTTLTEDVPVSAVAFSPDGTLIATASGNYTAYIWDTATATLRTTFTEHGGYLSAVAFSPDGTLIATASGDNSARSWDIATGTLRTAFTGQRLHLRVAAFSSDSTLIATASADGTACIWDTATGTLRTTLAAAAKVNSVAFSPDGTVIATASDDSTAQTWSTATGALRTTFTGHRAYVEAVAFSPDGTMLATASVDNTARIWDTATGTLRATLAKHKDYVFGVAFSPDGTLIATASNDYTARIWRASTGAPRTTLTGHSAWVRAVAFSPDGTLIATASHDRTARIWKLGAKRSLWNRQPESAVLAGHAGPVWDVAFSPDGSLLATASEDGTARVWGASTHATHAVLDYHNGPVTRVAFSPDGALLATASADGASRIWDTASGAHVATLVALPGGGYITLLPDGRYKADRDPARRVWWAIKLCRFEAGQLDPYVPGLRRLAAEERVSPVRGATLRSG